MAGKIRKKTITNKIYKNRKTTTNKKQANKIKNFVLTNDS